MRYQVVVTSVHDRGDLLDRTLRSMLLQLDQRPARIILHEDVRAGQPFVLGRTEDIVRSLELESRIPVTLLRTSPGGGLARGIVKALAAAETEFVFYTQEDFDFLRPVPIESALNLMAEHRMNQVRFNKRKTMRIKGEDRPAPEQWKKIEVTFGDQVFCISDRWYHQAALWRRDVALRGYSTLLEKVPAGRILERCEDRFDHWFNTTIGGGAGSVDGDQEKRRDLCRAFIWGGVGEPAFVRHTGGERRSQGWG